MNIHEIRDSEERKAILSVVVFLVLIVAAIVVIFILPPEPPRCRDVYANTPLMQVPAGCLDRGSLK